MAMGMSFINYVRVLLKLIVVMSTGSIGQM